MKLGIKNNGRMKFYQTFFISFVVAISGCGTNGTQDAAKNSETATRLFTLMDSKETGIDFTNSVVDERAFNILTYRIFIMAGESRLATSTMAHYRICISRPINSKTNSTSARGILFSRISRAKPALVAPEYGALA
jgi:hypothetical protein